jgi:hypothetical protein
MTTTSLVCINTHYLHSSKYISRFKLEVRYKPGKKNTVPDTLSCLEYRVPPLGHPTPSAAVLQTQLVALPSIGAPKDGIAVPKRGIGAPRDSIAVPKPGIGAPKDSIAVPKPGIGVPKDSIAVPKPSIGAPKGSTSGPEISHLKLAYPIAVTQIN